MHRLSQRRKLRRPLQRMLRLLRQRTQILNLRTKPKTGPFPFSKGEQPGFVFLSAFVPLQNACQIFLADAAAAVK